MEGQPPADIPREPPPLARAPDKFPLSTSRFVRTGILAVILAFGLALALILVNEVTRRDTPEDFAKLCQILLEPATMENPPQVLPSEAEKAVATRRLLADLPRLSRRCRKLAPVAREVNTAERRYEQLAKGFPNLPLAGLGASEALVGLIAQQRGIAADGAQRTLKEAAKAAEVIPELREIWVQRHVEAVELAELAPQFSAPPVGHPPLGIQFREQTPGFLGSETKETAFLANTSGRELRNCVIELRVFDPRGASYLQIHFARTWPAGQVLSVTYSDSAPTVPRFDAVAGVAVRLLSADLSTGWANRAPAQQGWQQF